MSTQALVSVEEYLRTSYDPDCDYVDGEIQERNLGEFDHGNLQSELIHYLRARRKKLNLFAIVEQRVQVSARRFRVPDLCLYVGQAPKEQVFRTPPFACIEILSPEDRLDRMQSRIDDYLDFGVRYVWVINPGSRRVWSYFKGGSTELTDAILRTEDPALEIPLAEVFAELDD
jgi:Uma2 family endonuclease